MKVRNIQWLALTTLALAITVGCNGDTTSTTDSTPATDSHSGEVPQHDDHAGHDHGAMGTHGGHVVVLDPGHIHAEWVHDDEAERFEFYVTEADQPKVTVTGVKVVSTIKDQEPQTVELEPLESGEEDAFFVKSPNVLTNIEMADGETVKVDLIVTAEEGEMSVELSDDHDHDHDH